MSELWVDTDFGFDDLWALLLLRHLGVQVAGISLVAGNAPLPQVVANALGAQQAYAFDSPLFEGAEYPFVRQPETAERILGPHGMLSRGRHLSAVAARSESPNVTHRPDLPDVIHRTDLPDVTHRTDLPDVTHRTDLPDVIHRTDLPDVTPRPALPNAFDGLHSWLQSAGQDDRRDILAIGPLTNIAALVRDAPEVAQKITRLTWMGGSNGPGNHSAQAEFNALADPEAAALVAQTGLPLDVIDLMLCRTVIFGPDDLPQSDSLTSDLLGGYLDIALSRGRSTMAIYDPVAALAACQPKAFEFQRCSMSVSVDVDASYGKTQFVPTRKGSTRIAIRTIENAAQICLTALATEYAYVD